MAWVEVQTDFVADTSFMDPAKIEKGCKRGVEAALCLLTQTRRRQLGAGGFRWFGLLTDKKTSCDCGIESKLRRVICELYSAPVSDVFWNSHFAMQWLRTGAEAARMLSSALEHRSPSNIFRLGVIRTRFQKFSRRCFMVDSYIF